MCIGDSRKSETLLYTCHNRADHPFHFHANYESTKQQIQQKYVESLHLASEFIH